VLTPAQVLSFETYPAPENCGSSSNITLNGVYLPQEWNGNFASGAGSYSGVTDLQKNAWFLNHNLDLEWESACIFPKETEAGQKADDAAQVLTVSIKSIDGKPVQKPTGFTLSFKQTSPPELLRFEPIPNLSASEEANAEDWRAPPAHLRLSPSPSGANIPSSEVSRFTSLEEDLRELQSLQSLAEDIQKAIEEKKKYIKSQIEADSGDFRKGLQKCDRLGCYFKVISDTAHGAWRLFISHPPKEASEMGRPDDPYAEVWRAGAKPEAAIKIESISEFTPLLSDDQATFPPRPSDDSSRSSTVVILKIFVGVLCCGCLFSVVRQSCASPRTKAERAARQEEQRNIQAYRRAARRHAWRKWFRPHTWRDQDRIEDYEEKRALIRHRESTLEEAMQEEIRQLRTAHGMVNALVQAEEGRSRVQLIPQPYTCPTPGDCRCPILHDHPHYGSVPPSPTSSTYMSENSVVDSPSRPLSRTSSLPSYRSDASTAPPGYESEEDMSGVVANGFRYRPVSPPTTLTSASRWTPDSSIVDVSPRPSAETLRYSAYAESEGTSASDGEDKY
jgi:hypothetical protein